MKIKITKLRIAIIVLATLFIILALGIWYYFPFFNTKETFIKSYDEGFILKSNQQETKTKEVDTIKSVWEGSYENVEVFLSSYAPNNLILSVVYDDTYSDLIYQYKIRRTLTGIEYLDYRKIWIDDIDFEDLKKYAKDNNLFESSDDRIQTPPTKQEVEESKKESELLGNPEFLKKDDECRKKYLFRGEARDYQNCYNKLLIEYGAKEDPYK